MYLYPNIYPTRCNVTQFILSGNCSTCFGWYHHPLSGAQTTVSTPPTAHSNQFQLFHDSGRQQQRCDKYQMLQIQLFVLLPLETCRAVFQIKLTVQRCILLDIYWNILTMYGLINVKNMHKFRLRTQTAETKIRVHFSGISIYNFLRIRTDCGECAPSHCHSHKKCANNLLNVCHKAQI